MDTLDSEVLKNIKIGIIGCGHLGQAILESLINHEFLKENIFVSYKGNPSTYSKIAKLGAVECISENQRIFNEADVIFITTKPQDIIKLKEIHFSKNTLVVSCAAGISVGILESIFKNDICRIMISGPDTIISEKGVATIYPYNELASSILNKINLCVFKASSDKDIDIFTAGVCLPAALLQENNQIMIKEAVDEIGKDSAVFLDLYQWARKTMPCFNTETEKVEYIARMVTKGGVTEAIIDSLKSGEPFITALKKGISRSSDISAETYNYTFK